MVAAGVGSFLGTINAYKNGDNITEGFLKGSLAGAMDGLVFALSPMSGFDVLGISAVQALSTRGNVAENFVEYSFSNAVPASFSDVIYIYSPERARDYLGPVGYVFAVKDVNDTNCNKEKVTKFARQNLCIN